MNSKLKHIWLKEKNPLLAGVFIYADAQQGPSPTFEDLEARADRLYCPYLEELYLNSPKAREDTESTISTIRAWMGDIIRLGKQGLVDELTQMYNRRYFDEEMKREFDRAKRYGTTFSLLMLDIDKFKEVNDALGHPGGDKALKMVAKIIEKVMRDTDIATRYGGEEFGIILPNTGNADAITAAERIRSGMKEELKPFLIQEYGDLAEQLMGTVSIGIATFRGEEKAEEIVERADRALYKAKGTGEFEGLVPEEMLRNRVVNGDTELTGIHDQRAEIQKTMASPEITRLIRLAIEGFSDEEVPDKEGYLQEITEIISNLPAKLIRKIPDRIETSGKYPDLLMNELRHLAEIAK
ncbi:GGDEF domain-containing protein, partial [Patescibacteria group bacterium]|nr:GGDEF domain-containing protein [Patescibacteria group bacterium]